MYRLQNTSDDRL